MFDFRFNTPIPFLNQGQGSVFKAINSPHKFTPRGSFVKKFSTRPCFGLHPEDIPHYNKRPIIRRLVTVTVSKFKIAVTIFEISKHENVGYKN